MNPIEVKHKFPIFKIYPYLCYLDNAATTQKPEQVLATITDFYTTKNANVHRGLYPLATQATDAYENAREKIATCINAEPDEIIFVSNATDGLNHIARSLVDSGLVTKDSAVLLTELDHHSSMLPWRMISSNINYVSVDQDYQYNINAVSNGMYDVVTFPHISNVTGTIAPVSEFRKLGKYMIIDATQSIAHIPIDVKALDADFLVFSGHKAYGPMGVGVVYAKKELLKQIAPFNVGGGMISLVTKDEIQWASIPEKFEAGTPNVAGSVGLAAAFQCLINMDFREIVAHEAELREYALKQLATLTDVTIVHPPQEIPSGGVISMYHATVHAHDIAQFLGDKGVCVRAGHHCTHIFHRDVLKIPATFRISFGVYNTKDDIDRFITHVTEAVELFGK